MTSNLVNIWNRISVWCLNHDDPVPMKIMSNTELIKTPFYACETAIDGENNTARFKKENTCPNRLNLDDYQGLVMKFLDYVSEMGITADFKNFTFYYKGIRQKIFVRVLEYSNTRIRLGIRNVSVLGGAK